MTPVEIEALTADDLGAEMGNMALPYVAPAFLLGVAGAVAHAARTWPEEAAENPHGLAHDIASGTDWGGSKGGEEWHWQRAYALSKILLDSYTPEEV